MLGIIIVMITGLITSLLRLEDILFFTWIALIYDEVLFLKQSHFSLLHHVDRAYLGPCILRTVSQY
ncbi:hypothetical protein T01_11019, partial [Trichinella spiralis]